MNRLVLHRILLTIGAIVGLLPVTLVFLWGSLFFVVGAAATLPEGLAFLLMVLCAMLISVFCLWASWKTYALSMSSAPKIKSKATLVTGVLATIIWGVIWACIGKDIQNTAYIFLMPGLTAATMLAVVLKKTPLPAPDA